MITTIHQSSGNLLQFSTIIVQLFNNTFKYGFVISISNLSIGYKVKFHITQLVFISHLHLRWNIIYHMSNKLYSIVILQIQSIHLSILKVSLSYYFVLLIQDVNKS